MKKYLCLTTLALSVACTAFAGADAKTVVTPEPAEKYGVGPYIGLQFGANVDASFDKNPYPYNIASDPGFVGGLKVGCPFGTGLVRPTIEGDFFYNGASLKTQDAVVSGHETVDSFVIASNFILRFDLGRFQPYVGGGVGVFFANVTTTNTTRTSPQPQQKNTNASSQPQGRDNIGMMAGYSLAQQSQQQPQQGGPGGNQNGPGTLSTAGSDTGLAYQAIAGVDYYLDKKWSVFTEYKFLAFADVDTKGPNNLTLNQHLVVAGVRYHF